MSVAEANEFKIPEWTLADRLRKVREDAGLKQEDMAAHFHVAVSSISAYEQGRQPGRKVSFEELVRGYAEMTGFDAAWIAGFRTGRTSTGPDGLAPVIAMRPNRGGGPRGGGGGQRRAA